MHAIQGTLDDLGTSLSQVTFVVVDLETTGGSALTCRITEIGAVRVRGGEVLGEFQTLVNPGIPIPAFISVLTGITDQMVASAPAEDSVIPAFLEFTGECVLVAHNAPFDVGFLKAAARRLQLPWPDLPVLDTVTLARRLVTRDEVPDHKLSSLAALFSTGVTPDHRALHDARATVDVLHALLARAGSHDVTTIEELSAFTCRVSDVQRRKRHLAGDLPSEPGVYLFKDHAGHVLYAGTSSDIRRRVRSYFTAAEQRSRIRDMLSAAAAVTPVVCATVLEAQVRELRLIAEHDPPYNRRSRRPERAPWIKLTAEPFPRLSVVRQVRDDGACYAGPFASQASALEAISALHEVVPLRRCTTRLRPGQATSTCALAGMGRCPAPCEGTLPPAGYDALIRPARDLLTGDSRAVAGALQERLGSLAGDERFEEAAVVRDRAAALVRGAARSQESFALTSVAQIVAGRRLPAGGWELACIRHGRLAGAAVSPRAADPAPYIASLTATAAVEDTPQAGLGAALAEEVHLVAQWLAGEGTRLISVDGVWACPVNGAGGYVHVFGTRS